MIVSSLNSLVREAELGTLSVCLAPGAGLGTASPPSVTQELLCWPYVPVTPPPVCSGAISEHGDMAST